MSESPPVASLKLPAPFGKYLLTELIALGGMAEVYRAKIFGAHGFEKDMVVKRILPKYAKNPSFVQMLIDEAKIAVSLSHGNIVPIYELGELDGSYYIAMEFVEGRTVLDVLRDAHSKRVPIPWAHCMGIAAEVAKGLAYAHTRTDPQTNTALGLIHRDINPRNIVVTGGGEVKILDFGIARASTKRYQTASGVIKGTPGYMSPEQMYGQAIDQRSDLYCVGIMLFELLTLRRLFPVWDVNEMRLVYEAGPVPLPSSLNKDLPPAVDAVLSKALAQKVTDRYQSAADFEEALRTAIAQSGIAVTASGLARALVAIDDAPGPRAPRTQPAAMASPDGTHQVTTPGVRIPGDSSSAGNAVAPGQSAVPAPSSAANAGPMRGPGPMPGPMPAPLPLPSPSPTPPPASPSAASSGGAPPRTQPMPLPKQAPALVDAEHSFVISLADQKLERAPEPLPTTAIVRDKREGPKTQVLAQNQRLDWSQNIGNDAEILAIAQAMGTAPGQGKRTLMLAAGVVAVVAIVLSIAFGGEMLATVQRAFAGKTQKVGTIIVKTRPSPDDVIIDGESKGPGNKKVVNVDIDAPHRIVVKPKGHEPIVREITRKDFDDGLDGTPTFVLEKDYKAPPVDLPETTP